MPNIAQNYLKATATGQQTPVNPQQQYILPAGPKNPNMSYEGQKTSGGGVAGGGGGSFGPEKTALQESIQNTKTSGSSITSGIVKDAIIKTQENIDKAKAQNLNQYGMAPAEWDAYRERIAGEQETVRNLGNGLNPMQMSALAEQKRTPTATIPQSGTTAQTAQTAQTTQTAQTVEPAQTSRYFDEASQTWKEGTAPIASTLSPQEEILKRQEELLNSRYNALQEQIASQRDAQLRQTQAESRRTLGTAGMQLARMGAVSSGSGLSYLQSLEGSYNNKMMEIQREFDSAIIDAENLKSEGMLKLAQQRIDYANEKAKEVREMAKEKREELKFTMEMEDLSRKFAKADREDFGSFSEGLIASGIDFNDVPDEYIKTKFNLEPVVARGIYALSKDARESKMDEIETKKLDRAIKFIDIADKLGAGVQIPIGDYTYTYQGFNADNTVGGTETDISGSVKYWTLNKKTGETKTYDLGIAKEKDGWETVNLGENGVWAINANTGESKPFFASTGQQTWDQGDFATGQTGPSLQGSSAKGECGASNNYFYGKFVVGDTLESKIEPLKENQVTNINDVRVGMSFVQNIGSTGHIGFIESIGIDPSNKKSYFTIFESNYNGDGKIRHGRKMYFDDPSLVMISDYPAPNLPKVGSDASVLLREGRAQEQLKPLSASELKTFMDLGYEVAPGMTMDDVKVMKKTLGGKTFEIPSFEDFSKQMQESAGQSLEPENLQEMYTMTIGKIQPIADAAEVITTGMTSTQSKATISAINKALDRGDIIGAQQQLKAASIASLPAPEGTKVRGRESGIDVLQKIQGLLSEYKQKGGEMGIITGTEEQIAAKIGKVIDPERRKIAIQIRSALIDYRQSVSGAAFTESEMVEYKGLFPSISNSYDLNQAKIDGLVRAWSASNEATYRQIMTPSLYEQIWQ